MGNRHCTINNTNRFIRSEATLATEVDRETSKLHENIDNEARIPAKTICGLTIEDPVYYNEIRSVSKGPCSSSGCCIWCHEEMVVNPDANK